MTDTLEMELIAKLYNYLTEEEMKNWTIENAQNMYEDEIRISNEHGYECPIESAEVLFYTVKELIEQDLEENEQ